MDNVWKGLAVGAVTGAAVGLTMDLLGRGGDTVANAVATAREHGPDLARAVSSAAKDAAYAVGQSAKVAAAAAVDTASTQGA